MCESTDEPDPSTPSSMDRPVDRPVSDGSPKSSRLGLILFAGYTLLYLGFVLINAFASQRMETIVLAGLNLAIVYGFGLILVAIALSLVYGLARRGEVDS